MQSDPEAYSSSVPQIVPEKRLVATRLSKKPHPKAFYVASAIVFMCGILTIVYWLNLFNLAVDLPANYEAVFKEHQYWRLFTAIFIHVDAGHFFSNIFLLWILSFFVYGYCGFILYPISSFFIAAGANALAVWTYGGNIDLLGASGLVYVLGGFWLCFYFFVQRTYSKGHRLLRVIGIAMVIFLPSGFVSSTSYRTHAFGFLGGVIMALIYFYKNKKNIRSDEVIKYTANVDFEKAN